MYLTRNLSSIRSKVYCCGVVTVAGLLVYLIAGFAGSGSAAAQEGPVAESAAAIFSNPTPITIPAIEGTGNPYPSTINVAGMTGTVSNTAGSVKVTINNFSHTFNSDVIIALVGPGGQALMIQGRAGISAVENNVTYTLSDTGTQTIPDPSWGPGTYKPTNWTSLDTQFPAPGPGTSWANPGPGGGGTATFSSVFGGTNPNGNWNLFVYDMFDEDGGSIAGGWSLEIITTGGAPVPDAQGDYDADGTTDYAVVRNAGDINGQITWHISHNSTGIPRTQTWGFGNDAFVPADYDGDQKDDIAVWRSGGQGVFHIIQSGSNTIRSVAFGTLGDNPAVVGDYNADGVDDIAVYRQGATPGAQSFFYFTYGGVTYAQPWGLNGDVPAPGDYDGDNRMDFAIQRGEGGNGVFYIRYTVPQADTVTTFGLSSDIIVPGYYDADAKTDLAVVNDVGGFLQWTYRPSAGGSDVVDLWGVANTDLPVPGDYNGDGKNDYAVYRPGASPAGQSTFHVMRPVTRHIETRPWGLGDDQPVNFTFAHF
jgi:subtilisin-like proprotein convertase family protein